MSNLVLCANSVVAPHQPRAVLGLCLVLFAACSFDSGNLRHPKPGDAGPSKRDASEAGDADPRDARYDARSGGDGPGADRSADAAHRDAFVNDTRGPEPDSAVATDSHGIDSPGVDSPRDLPRDQGGETLSRDSRDTGPTLDDGGSPFDTTRHDDAFADTSRPPDGVITDTAGEDDAGGGAADAAPDADSMAAGGAPDSGQVIDPYLVLWYRFDENGDTVAYDSAQKNGTSRNATLMTEGVGGTAAFSTTRQVGTRALALAPGSGPLRSGGGYAVIPALDELAPDAVTIAVWVRLAAAGPAQVWERIYDFGDSTTAPRWLNLTARSATSPFGPVFNMSKTGHDTQDQQKLTGTTALTANTWHHIAVVLPASEGETFTGVMYVNGEGADTNGAMTVHFRDIGPTLNNWIGRSQYPDDPYFNGFIDDFRVYSRALSQAEIQALMAVR
mgnify:CR=1 FL=1